MNKDIELALTENYFVLMSRAITLTRHREDAQDLVQDTLLRAWKYRSTLRDAKGCMSWLYTIMRNVWADHRTFTTTPLDCASRIAVECEPCMDALPSTYNLLSMYGEGYSYRDIAECQHIPIGTVKSRIHSQRKQLLKEYKYDTERN